MSEAAESNGSPQSDASNIERLSEDDTNGQISGGGADVAALHESILRNELILVGSSSSPSSTPEVTSTPVDTLSPSTHQNEVETQRTTTSHIQSSLGQHPNEWSTETVLSWFQFHKLDELYNSLFAPHETKNGKILEKIFQLKRQNYDFYKAQYISRFKPGQNNLLTDFNRFNQLLDECFKIDKYTHRFDVALSFPGEIRDKVKNIVDKLSVKINPLSGRKRIFYDNDYRAELARPNLDLYLQNIYRYQARLIVVFMCGAYTQKEWCRLESRAIRDLLKTVESDRIMLLKVDEKPIDGILSIDGDMNISNDTDEVVADAIYSRLIALGDPQPQSNLHLSPPSPPPPQKSVISKVIMASKNTFHSISPWYIVVFLLAYILGAKFGY